MSYLPDVLDGVVLDPEKEAREKEERAIRQIRRDARMRAGVDRAKGTDSTVESIIICRRKK